MPELIKRLMRKILILAALLLTTSLAAQENTGNEQDAPKAKFAKQHSIEITTGYPSIVHNLEYPSFGLKIAVL